MKRVIQHPPEAQNGRRYWRSLEEYAQTPEFKDWLEREFPAGAQELEMDGVSRRNFLQLMGASVALAGLGMAGCRRPETYIVPFTKSPEWLIPGRSLQYATAMPRRRGAMPLLATSYDTRPTKLEGNPLFPRGRGATDVFAQASILDLYDPDRSRSYKEKGVAVTRVAFESFLDQVRTKQAAKQGQGLALLWESSTSPTRERLRTELLKQFPKLNWYVHEPVSQDNELDAAQAVLGGLYVARPRWSEPNVIVTIDSDFLGNEEGGLAAAKGYSSRRQCDKAEDKMNRLYAVESRFSNTGGLADHRLRLANRWHLNFVVALAKELIALGVNGSLAAAINGLDGTLPGVDANWVKELAVDLAMSKGKSLVVVGSQHSVVLHALVQVLNDALGNLGATVDYVPALSADAPGLKELVAAIETGTVDTLIVVGGNPAYNAPADLNFANAVTKVSEIVQVSLQENETTALATWHAPLAHYLETWGDARAVEGTYLTLQPLVMPLFDGISELEILAKLLGLPRPAGPELVQTTFQEIAKLTPGSSAFNNAWTTLVHDGFLAQSDLTPVKVSANGAKVGELAQKNPVVTTPTDALEVVFYADPKVDDGRYNNNGWLQELPEPITKLTWDNAALISPRTAQALKVTSEDVVTLEVDGRKLDVAVLIAPGQADNSLSISLGYGRSVTGRVGTKTGFNAYALRVSDQTAFLVGAKVAKTGRTYPLNSTQIHYSMEGRALARESTVATYHENPDFVDQMGIDSHQPGYDPANPVYAYQSAYKNPLDKFKADPVKHPHQWGMVIDLNTCTGCNACVIACQSENNIPIVGKDQVRRGREMHWIRIDRYFSSEQTINGKKLEEDWGQYPDEPQMLMQPVACMQCENAPCETVCPVNATVHNEEGLNVMAYNRCIGTRYCANNCPYKVRRFNYFDYNQRPVLERNKSVFGKLFGAEEDSLYYGPFRKKGMEETLKMSKNPNVTVRMRGVMEKCTYCVQRIENAKIDQIVKAKDTPNITIKTDSFQVACQQVCPAEAIVFGNIIDPNSAVSKQRGNKREYGLLAYIGTKPRTTYLARIRNPNPKMPGADLVGVSTPIGHHHGGHEAHEATEAGHHAPEEKAKPEVAPTGGQH